MSTQSFVIALVCFVLIAALVLFSAVREDAVCEMAYAVEMEG